MNVQETTGIRELVMEEIDVVGGAGIWEDIERFINKITIEMAKPIGQEILDYARSGA